MPLNVFGTLHTGKGNTLSWRYQIRVKKRNQMFVLLATAEICAITTEVFVVPSVFLPS